MPWQLTSYQDLHSLAVCRAQDLMVQVSWNTSARSLMHLHPVADPLRSLLLTLFQGCFATASTALLSPTSWS